MKQKREPSRDRLISHEEKALIGYSREALSYDKERYLSFPGRLHLNLVYEVLEEWIDKEQEIQILDIATGTGIGAIHFAGGKAKVFGVDLTKNMLQIAYQKLQKSRRTNITFQIGNARLLPYKENSFDYIFSLRLYHHIPNMHRKEYINEIKRVLKPGGIAILDFKNAFYGVLINLVREYIFREKGGYYLWPHQVSDLFSDMKILERRGIYLTCAQIIARRYPKTAKIYLTLARYFPFYHLSFNQFIICQKEGKQST